MERDKRSEDVIASFFVVIPTVFVIIGLLFFPYPLENEVKILLSIPLFTGLILLGIGFFLKKENITNKLKIAGWVFFAFYWSARLNSLYFSEGEDIVNAFLCIAGVYVLSYFAYHEWFSMRRKNKKECLNWVAGAASIAGFIYFIIELTPLAPWLIDIVAAQSGGLLNVFTGNVKVVGDGIYYNGKFTVNIIFACTAIQSMVLFVGMILPLTKVNMKRRLYGLLITVVPIYFLNLIRNAGITYLMGENITSFSIAHNIVGKGGSLIALILLLFIVIKIVPEVFDEITDLIDLSKRDGPLEKFIKKIVWRKK